jgi:low molecular weight protein-tyrosine phosphatase
MAEGVLREKLAREGAFGAITVDSAGTNAASVGRRADGRARVTILRHGSTIRDIRTRALVDDDFDVFDLILVMDEAVRAEVLRRTRTSQDADKVRMLLDYAGGGEISDPIHGTRDDFERVYETIELACQPLAAELGAAINEDTSDDIRVVS